jgi:pyruvate/2-oxoglutarate dehydrogenase complex dihydrolipoamide dehydrogenase (E3) component
LGKLSKKTKYMKREVAAKKSYLGKRAIVVGAGLGGLSAARVLSEYFAEVMILDRDELPDNIVSESNVPAATGIQCCWKPAPAPCKTRT